MTRKQRNNRLRVAQLSTIQRDRQGTPPRTCRHRLCTTLKKRQHRQRTQYRMGTALTGFAHSRCLLPCWIHGGPPSSPRRRCVRSMALTGRNPNRCVRNWHNILRRCADTRRNTCHPRDMLHDLGRCTTERGKEEMDRQLPMLNQTT